jgi:NAD(P)-dependent dehydrogenase (short-subunit alcohol dehydrogenase family)
MNPRYNFAQQVAFVTGAGEGMGRATAEAFAAAGAAVVLTDVRADTAEAAADGIVAAGGRAIGFACDVTDEDQVAAAIARTVETYGRLNMAFNNAGIQAPAVDLADQSADDFDQVAAINLRGTWACMKHELRQMRTLGMVRSSTTRRPAISSLRPIWRPTTPPSSASSA